MKRTACCLHTRGGPPPCDHPRASHVRSGVLGAEAALELLEVETLERVEFERSGPLQHDKRVVLEASLGQGGQGQEERKVVRLDDNWDGSTRRGLVTNLKTDTGLEWVRKKKGKKSTSCMRIGHTMGICDKDVGLGFIDTLGSVIFFGVINGRGLFETVEPAASVT